MKKTLATLLVLAPFAGHTQAALIFGGDMGLYKPGTGYTVTATLDGVGAFDSYAQGVGDGVPLAGGVATVTWGDGSGQSDPGGPVDFPGWVSINGGSPDTGGNGVGGSSGMNIFAGWGGQQRVETSSPVGTIALGEIYTITAQVDGPAGGPIDGDLAFHLMANGVQLTPTSMGPDPVGGSGFQTLSRTYEISTLPVGVSAGDPMTIILGVADTNGNGNRMIWDDVTFEIVPEPSSILLVGLGGLALVRRKRK